jgi:hypothetical protein
MTGYPLAATATTTAITSGQQWRDMPYGGRDMRGDTASGKRDMRRDRGRDRRDVTCVCSPLVPPATAEVRCHAFGVRPEGRFDTTQPLSREGAAALNTGCHAPCPQPILVPAPCPSHRMPDADGYAAT